MTSSSGPELVINKDYSKGLLAGQNTYYLGEFQLGKMVENEEIHQ